MLVIGESIHVISRRVRVALEERDKGPLQSLAVRQVEKGAHVLDLNIGPQRREGREIMPWLVDALQEVVDVPFCLDTTNAAAIEAGIKRCRREALINSTDATDARMSAMMPLAVEHNAALIALALGESGLPSTAEERLDLVLTRIAPAAESHGLPLDRLYLDPLVLTVNGMQDQAAQAVIAVHYFREVSDPPPKTTCGVSNVSNGVPSQNRALVNEVFMAMMLGAGITSAIVDPLDEGMMWTIRTVEDRDCSTRRGALLVALADAAAAAEELTVEPRMLEDPETSDVAKTINILYNRQIYAHSYLGL